MSPCLQTLLPVLRFVFFTSADEKESGRLAGWTSCWLGSALLVPLYGVWGALIDCDCKNEGEIEEMKY